MSTETEYILEKELVARLQEKGYTLVHLNNEKQIIANLKTQLEKHNNVRFSTTEFDKVLNILSKGTTFEKAKTLRERQYIERDNGDHLYFSFINTEQWCQNEFQVTHQVTMEGSFKNRYDVTLLINGLPLVQIELKKRGLELKEAFNQINRYQRHSFGASYGLFQYVQIFIISNGVNTKYYANNKEQSFKQTFYWTDSDNKRITNVLNGFTDTFLDPCHVSKMICKYIVLNETRRIPMILRPYQFYAVEALVNHVKTSTKNGYIWHTTGSGKTLTSFKASQIIMKLPDIKKVVFVVDRKDLDYQTIKEFESFKSGCVDATTDTAGLVEQFSDDTKLIVTTIQKLNAAITKTHHLKSMERLQHEKIVFIFDECHRSQFGKTHEKIKTFFTNHQMFGFTGTPLFAENAAKVKADKPKTTTEVFDEILHKYVITDAIRDENVLKFSVEYVGRYKEKQGHTYVDIEAKEIDKRELMRSPQRFEKIVEYIIHNHNRKTHNKAFTGMMCVDSVESLIKYYEIFQKKKEAGEHSLKIATIFSYMANEDDQEAAGTVEDEELLSHTPKTLTTQQRDSREKLEEYIGHYNGMFGTKYTTKDNDSFYRYYINIAQKVKDRQVDILLVVNMFLTGFDSPSLNTLYVDKNLQYHGLIQAFSRTNRILDERKSQGNIVCFRNLKQATDQAITLFSNKEAIEVIIMKPYENYTETFNTSYKKLKEVVPTVDSVNDLESEEDELKFITAFREIMRGVNVLTSFTDFTWDDVEMSEQEFNNYRSKYLDLWQKTKSEHNKDKVSVLQDIDFELELIHRDEINVTYILKLLINLKGSLTAEQDRKKKHITELLSGEATLRSKKELIEKFINEQFPSIKENELITSEFEKFWNEEKEKALKNIIQNESLSRERTETLIEATLFAERPPLRDDILSLIEGKAISVLERKKTGERILSKITDYIETFIYGIPEF